MSLIAELQRRKVFKVGAAYLVVGWLLIQIAATLIPYFAIPGWTLRLVTLLVLLGFPLALVMAWMFDVTPEGLQVAAAPVGNKRVFAISAGLVALAIAWYFHGQPAFRKDEVAPLPVPAKVVATVDPHSIAVLPFVNMSDDKANEYFSDGLSEQLLNQLAQIPQLRVIARTSSFSFKGKEVDIATIAKALNVANVLEGSVRKSGKTLRITAQLIRTADSTHLWSQTYDRELTDIFKVQDEISNAIAQVLEAKLSGQPASGTSARTATPAAYDEYLQGRAFLARRLGDNLVLAIKAFDRAIALDPSFSPAWSARGFAYTIEPGWSGTYSLDEAFAKALADADAALRLDPDNAEAYMVRGNFHSLRLQEGQARADFDRALQLAPGSVDILNFAGDNFEYFGNLRAAERLKRQAMALDPLSFIHPANLAQILSAQGRFQESVELASRSVDLGGDYVARIELAFAQVRLGQVADAAVTTKAICDARGEFEQNCMLSRIRIAKARGDQRELTAAVARIIARVSVRKGDQFDTSDVAGVIANEVGDMKAATALLRRVVGGVGYGPTFALLRGPHGAQLPEEISTDPEWLAVWADPRFSEGMMAYRTNLAAFRKGD